MKAFPHDTNVTMAESRGMDLRDYFAAKAMQAYIEIYEKQHLAGAQSLKSDSELARMSYIAADAMMEARQ